MKLSRTAPLLAMLVGTGCYSYQAIPAPVPMGIVVRADLNDEGTPSARALLGPSAMRVEGVVHAADDSTLSLLVTEVTRRAGMAERWNGEPVRLSRQEITQVSVRSFSGSRTALAGALTIGAALIAARAFHGGGDGATLVVGPQPPSR